MNRDAKISRITAAIAAGKYKCNPAKIVDGMIKHMERLAKVKPGTVLLVPDEEN